MGAIEALTRTLALELAPCGIGVNLVHPPLTNTKSAAPLGIPPQAMADPAEVRRKLAKKILAAGCRSPRSPDRGPSLPQVHGQAGDQQVDVISRRG